MSDPNRSIFLDLEIDVVNMMKDPDDFASQVYTAADKLLNVLNSKNSLKGAHNETEAKARKDQKAKTYVAAWFKPTYDEIYEASEKMTVEELYHLIQETKDLTRDLELQFHSRARNEMIMNTPNSTDKKLAFDQYKRLREAFEAFREFAKLISDKVYTPLEAKTGNYGADSATSHPAYRYQGQVYNNYRAVARLLGWNPDEFHSHMDLCEKLEMMEINDVEVIQVTL